MNHHRKWIRRLMRWMWCVLVLTVCQQTLCIEQPFSLVAENTTCLDIEVASRLACTGNDQFYHCLLDENYTKEFEVCRDWKWIPGGKCAYFNSYGRGNVDERSCEGNSTLKCAPGQFRSYMNTQYKACYVKKRIPTTTPISTVTIRPTSSGGSVPPNITGGAPPGSVPPESQFDGSALAIALGVIVPLILLVNVGILLFKRRRHPGGTSKEELPVESGEVDTLLRTGTKYHEENEQNDRQQKRTSKEESPVESGEGGTLPSTQENEQNDKHEDERTSTEAMESSRLLAGNTNENQSQEDSVKNGDTSEVNKLDSSQKIDSFQTPPTSPTTAPATAQDIRTNDVVGAEKKKEVVLESKRTSSSPGEVSTSGTEKNLQLSSVDDKGKQNMAGSDEGNQSDREGNEEDTSKETERKEAVGTFVNSLESLGKEDDEEGGWIKLHELLEYMCTGPARKILFNVVKMFVDNPESYIHDESKKASIRVLLPPQYHSFLNPESKDRDSIPVSYAILRSSLSAEHQPKSGWGQEVKDTDTGVGDDVERVYKVHMLRTKIHTPKEISEDGYVRLFEMLIGAVERLDIHVKGEHSEEYKEIEGKWKDIQRKSWWKDTWSKFTNFTNFTNFIKIWSE